MSTDMHEIEKRTDKNSPSPENRKRGAYTKHFRFLLAQEQQ